MRNCIALVAALAFCLMFEDVTGLANGCNGVGDVHLFVFWSSLGQKTTGRAIKALETHPGMRILEVHVKKWPEEAEGFAACHRNFYANNHAEKGFTVPSLFLQANFVQRKKGTGPFTVVLVAVDCSDVQNVSVAPCDQSKAAEQCDNAPKADMLTFLKKRLRNTLSKGNKYAIHATVNGNEANHDVASLFGSHYYEELVRKKQAGALWKGHIQRDHRATCVESHDHPANVQHRRSL